jgi:flagellar biosynthesis GTPase FlhF
MSDQKAERAARAKAQRAADAKEYDEAMEQWNARRRKEQERLDQTNEWKAQRKAAREARKSQTAYPTTADQERPPEKQKKAQEQPPSISDAQDQTSSGSSSPSVYEDAVQQLPVDSAHPHSRDPKDPHPASEQIQELSPVAQEVVKVEPDLPVDGVDQLHGPAIGNRQQKSPNELVKPVQSDVPEDGGNESPDEPLIPMRQDGRESLDDELEDLPPKPIIHDFKLTPVEQHSVTSDSLHTGDQLHVLHPLDHDCPPSLGTTVMGMHPRASAWTKAPAWSHTIVALGIGAGLATIGYGIYKFITKKLTEHKSANSTEVKRLHARDLRWNARQIKLD